MRSHRFVIAAGIAAGLVGLLAVAVAATQPATPQRPGATTDDWGSVATAAGDSGGPVVYPGLVDVHFDRAIAAMADASAQADAGQAAAAIRGAGAARAQTAAAWVATRFLIRTTPVAPPTPDDRVKANGLVVGSGFAAPPDVSLAFFTLQHDLAATAAGLLSDKPALNDRLVTSLQSMAKLRNRAIAYIHKVAPPAPPPEDLAGADGPVASTFDSTMPSVLPLLDDEIRALRGTLTTYKKVLPADVVTKVRAVIALDNATKDTVNAYWPPLPADD